MKNLIDFKGLNGKVYPYIINCIDNEAYNNTELKTEREKLQFLADCFYYEKCKFNTIPTRKYLLFLDWLQGLPSCFNVAFENYEILQIAVRWESLPDNYTEKQADKILANWFNFITSKTFQLFNKYDITLK